MFDQLNFNHFSYSFFYDDGQNFNLINDTGDGMGKKFLQNCYAKGLYGTINEVEAIRLRSCDPQQCAGFLTPEVAATDVLPDAAIRTKYHHQISLAKKCNVSHRIYFTYRRKNYLRLTGFGSNAYPKQFHNFCLQHLPIFRQFIIYFEKEARVLLQEAGKFSLHLPPLSLPQLFLRGVQYFVGYDFVNKRKIELKLTLQESACLQKLTEGKSVKEIAQVLQLSPKTIETQIANLKRKLRCSHTSQLIDIFLTLSHR